MSRGRQGAFVALAAMVILLLAEAPPVSGGPSVTGTVSAPYLGFRASGSASIGPLGYGGCDHENISVAPSFNLTTGLGRLAETSRVTAGRPGCGPMGYNGTTGEEILLGHNFTARASQTYHFLYIWRAAYAAQFSVHSRRSCAWQFFCGNQADANVTGVAFGYVLDITSPAHPLIVWASAGTANATYLYQQLAGGKGNLTVHRVVSLRLSFSMPLLKGHRYTPVTGYSLSIQTSAFGGSAYANVDLGSNGNGMLLVRATHH